MKDKKKKKKVKDEEENVNNIKITKKSKSNEKKKKKAKSEKKNKQDDNKDEDENEELEELLLPGQKYPTPLHGDACRAYYESLLEQKRNSLMALKWCIEYGCLDSERVLNFKKGSKWIIYIRKEKEKINIFIWL